MIEEKEKEKEKEIERLSIWLNTMLNPYVIAGKLLSPEIIESKIIQYNEFEHKNGSLIEKKDENNNK